MPSLPAIEKDVEKRAAKAADHGAFDAPAAGEPDPARFDYLLRLGDDALILGQRLGEWCGHAPSVEVDLSLANLALDQIGQGTLLLAAAGEAEGAGRDADAYVELRTARDRTLPVPQLLLPALQWNIRGGRPPPADANGIAYLKVPLDAL